MRSCLCVAAFTVWLAVSASVLRGQSSQFSATTKPVPAEVLDQINSQRLRLAKELADMSEKVDPSLRADVEIYSKAAEWILRHGEFYTENYPNFTLACLGRGLARAKELADGKPKWPDQTGRLSRGFVSRVDRSVQPFGLVIPPSYATDTDRKWRLDVELHGRGATLTEVSFLQSRDSSQPVPPDQDFIELHIFGRTNNAYRWAGETDVFEAIEAVRRRYRIDERRIVLRGFSMGGAGAWHLGLHHPDRWCSVGPGAGFTDTKKYQKLTEPLPAWQESCLHIYDAEDYARNAFNVPIACYGGEVDPQLAAAQGMRTALETLGVAFTPDGLNASAANPAFLFLVGPKTGHQFHPESRARAMAFHGQHAAEPLPYTRDRLNFVTYTLRYPGAFGYRALELNRHYSPATIEARRAPDGVVEVNATNVAVLELSRGVGSQVRVGQSPTIDTETAAGGRLPTLLFRQSGAAWDLLDYDETLAEMRPVTAKPLNTNSRTERPSWAVKRPGLQGPIDDAFRDGFLCVRGTGEPWSPQVHAWSEFSLKRFTQEWDRWLRGTLTVRDDRSVSSADLRDNHLILFGDPGSNALIRGALKFLPVEWTEQSIRLGGKEYAAADHGLVMIYPNPSNPRRYIVINSGHTFHEAEFRGSNAQLYPRLGDFAVMQVRGTEAGFDERPVEAGIFDEFWRLPR